MAVVKTVTSGQPITAGWANSLVHEVNTQQGLRLSGKPSNSTSLRPVKAENTPAWQVSYGNGSYTINGGQLYLNGLLVGGHYETLASSYNMVCSASNYEEAKTYTPSSNEDLPRFWLQVAYTTPITPDNINNATCKLIVTKNDEAPSIPEDSTNPDNTTQKVYKNIQLTTVKGTDVLQMVSGSIYYNTTVSLVSGDGILIEEEASTNSYKVNLYMSFIADDGIQITEGYEPAEEEGDSTNVDPNKPKPHPMKVVRIKATNAAMSFIGIDGITVHDEMIKEDDGSEKRLITVEHDIKSFIGKDNIKVTEEYITSEVKDPNTGETTSTTKKCVIIQQDKPTKLSFIGEDGITVTQSDEEVTTTDDQGNATTEKVTVVTITGEEVGKFSFIGIDGITVAQSEEDVTKTDDQGNTTTEKMQVVTIGNDNSNEYEFVGKDGVEVTTEESTTTENGKEVKKTKVTIGASVIADVDVDVRGGTNVTVDKTTEGTTQVFTVNTTLPPELEQVSIVAGDGITVTHSSNTYTISATLSGITYDFDSSWFIVTDTNVTINEAKFEEVAASLAPTVTSQITTVATTSIDGVNDCGREGDIMLEINTTGDTASARAWTQW